MRQPISILVGGVGGQGVLTLAEIIGRALLLEGFVVKGTEVHGLAQRGGIVVSHIKAADYNLSPMVAPGSANLVVGLELIETVRLAKYMNKGTVVLANSRVIEPSIPGVRVPGKEELLGALKRYAGRVVVIDASKIAREIYGETVANTVMLGAVSQIGVLPVKRSSFMEAMLTRIRRKYHEPNIRAFEAGEEAARQAQQQL